MASIVKRLTNQLKSKGMNNAEGMAVSLLTKYGELKDGKLTEKGKKRQALGASGRAKDRAAKENGRSVSKKQ